jgi:hypothetical protein
MEEGRSNCVNQRGKSPTADLTHAHIWLNEHNVLAGIEIMLGSDLKKDYEGKVVDMLLP